MVGKTLPYLTFGLVIGSRSTWAGPIPRRSTKVERAPPPSFRFGHPYADRTPCWVEGRRGWVKDQTCGDLIDVDTSITVGKRHHSFDDPYFADGTPCFHHGREGIVEDLLCVDLDVEVGEHYPDSDYYGPWQFSHAYDEGRPCWVDDRRGWVIDGACGDLLELDADVLVNKRFYKDDPYYFNGVPCVKNGREGVITDYICAVVDIGINKRGHWGYNDHSQGLVDGAPCWHNGHEGIISGLYCVVADVSVDVGKRSAAGHADGEACTRNGRWGKYKNAICIDADVHADVHADVDVSARGLLGGNDLVGGLVDGLTGGHPYRPHNGRPNLNSYSHYREDDAIDIDGTVDVKRTIKTGDLKATVKSDTEIKSKNDVHVKRQKFTDAAVLINELEYGNKRRLLNDHKTDVDLKSKTTTKSDVKINRRHFHDGETAVDVKSDTDVNVDLKARGGDALIGDSVKNFGKSLDNALEYSKRDLGLDGLLDVVSVVDITDDGRGRYAKNKPGLLGGIVRRAPVAQPNLLSGLGGKPGPNRGKGKKKGLLGLGDLLG